MLQHSPGSSYACFVRVTGVEAVISCRPLSCLCRIVVWSRRRWGRRRGKAVMRSCITSLMSSILPDLVSGKAIDFYIICYYVILSSLTLTSSYLLPRSSLFYGQSCALSPFKSHQTRDGCVESQDRKQHKGIFGFFFSHLVWQLFSPALFL